MTLDAAYLILTFLLCMGAIQVTAAQSRMRGLLIIPHTAAAYSLGIAVAVAALVWFGASGYATTPGDIGGVEGAEQFIFFLGSAGASSLVTAIVASVTQRHSPMVGKPASGLEGLRQATLFQLLSHRAGKRMHARRPKAEPRPVRASRREAPR